MFYNGDSKEKYRKLSSWDSYENLICLQLYMTIHGKKIMILDGNDFGQISNTLDNRFE